MVTAAKPSCVLWLTSGSRRPSLTILSTDLQFLSTSHCLKTDGHRGKAVLRTLADQWLPSAVVKHPKHGFTISLDVLLTDNFFEVLRDSLLSADSRSRPLMNVELLRRWLDMLRCAQSGAGSNAISREGLYQRIFIIFALELWMRRYRLSW